MAAEAAGKLPIELMARIDASIRQPAADWLGANLTLVASAARRERHRARLVTAEDNRLNHVIALVK